MRYRTDQFEKHDLGELAREPGAHFVDITVWLTLIVGVVFIALGKHGRQRWLSFWGIATVLMCVVYFTWMTRVV